MRDLYELANETRSVRSSDQEVFEDARIEDRKHEVVVLCNGADIANKYTSIYGIKN